MKKRIMQTTLALMGLVASFLPQKAEACAAVCLFGSCVMDGPGPHICYCNSAGYPVCISA